MNKLKHFSNEQLLQELGNRTEQGILDLDKYFNSPRLISVIGQKKLTKLKGIIDELIKTWREKKKEVKHE